MIMESSQYEKFNQAMLEFKKVFVPVDSASDADETFTTRQVYDKFIKLTYARDFPITEFQDLLEKHGFKFRYFIDGFVWPMNYRVK